MAALHISLTGQLPTLTVAERAVGEQAMRRRQTRLALAALVLERSAGATKPLLAEILWGDRIPGSWETALRGIVGRVRAVLVEAGLHDPVSITPAGVQLRLPPDSTVDVEVLERSIREAEAALARGDAEGALALAKPAVEWSRRPFLPDCDGDWVERQRSRFAALRHRVLLVVAEAAVRTGDHRWALNAAEEILLEDPYAESAYRVLMRAHGASGERAAALNAYQRCRRLLRDELGVAPSPDTEAAYLTLLGREPVMLAGDARLPFVGRQHQLAALAAAWGEAEGGRRQAVLVTGTSGAGKSRLVAEFMASVEQAGHLVLRARHDGQLSLPFRPFAEAFGSYVEARGPGIVHELEDLGQALLRLRTASPSDPAASDHGGRAQQFAAVRRWLTLASSNEPLLLVIEDVQWADPASLALLRAVLDDGQVTHLLVVTTCRVADVMEPELAASLASLIEAPVLLRLALPPLTSEEVEELLQATVGEAPEGLGRVIAEHTGGNALYVAEAIRHLVGGHLSLDPRTLDLPAAIADLVELRLRSLSPEGRRLLELAALCGESARLDVLTSASEGDASIPDLLARASAIGLISILGTEVQFRHDLLRSAVERRIHLGAFPGLHRSLAVALDERDLDAELPQRAHHWSLAGGREEADIERAIEANRAAGRQALSKLAFERAAAHFDAAVALLDAHDPAGTRTALRCDLLIELGAALRDAGEARHDDVLRSAISAAYHISDPVRLARAILVLAYRGAARLVAANDPFMVATLRDALRDLPVEAGDLRPRLKAALALEMRWSERDLPAVWAMADEGVADARQVGRPEVIAETLMARHTIGYQRPEAMLRDASEMRQIAADLRNPVISCNASTVAFDGWIGIGKLGRAAVEIDHVATVADRSGLPYFRWISLTRRAGLCALNGAFEDAQRLVDEATTAGLQLGIEPSIVYTSRYGIHITVSLAQGQSTETVAALEAIESFAGGNLTWLTTMAVARAESGDLAGAGELFDRIVAARLDGIVANELGFAAAINLARVAARLNDPRGALVRDLLETRSGQMSWAACYSSGPVDLALAWAAIASGNEEEGARRFESALALCRAAGALPWTRLIEAEAARLR